MKWANSFRWRVLLGTVLWTVGLIPVLHLLFLVAHHQRRLLPEWAIEVFLVFAAVCVLAGIWQFRAGLRPLGRLRGQLLRLRDGSGERIEGTYPTEVQPVVNDLNSLLVHREQIVRRAVAKAGDLAHGLKTPLAVLTQEYEQLEAAGQRELAEQIRVQVDRMRRQVDYHLAQARAATPGKVPGARVAILACVEGLTRTLRKIYAARSLDMEIDVSPQHFIRGQREDLEEMLGNLLDNACKWANSRIRITSAQENDAVVVIVDDDGSGLAAAMRDQVLQRGVRADEAAPGSGLGLAIVRDLAQLYEGTITLEESPMGGLRAALWLPC